MSSGTNITKITGNDQLSGQLFTFLLLLILAQFSCTLAAQVPPKATVIPAITPSPTILPTPSLEIASTNTPVPDDSTSGKIVFTCQIAGIRYLDQICLINADGTGFKRLTTNDNSAHFYPSLAPDGNSVVYSANSTGNYEIYESDLEGNSRQVTSNLGTLTAPEISPDGGRIAFTLGDGVIPSVWLIDRDGTQPRLVYSPGWDPTWSPDGTQILFASYDQSNAIQLFVVNQDGSGITQVTQMPRLRGRSDWSQQGNWAVTYSGEPWGRELFIVPMNGDDPYQLTPSGGNSQGPSISPDGRWVVFTAYYGDIGNDDGCEIYKIRTDGTQLTRLTENEYCDWQPRWGP